VVVADANDGVRVPCEITSADKSAFIEFHFA
jgi:hypothetical protein